MSTCTFWAAFVVGVPEIVLVLSSYVSQLSPPSGLKPTVTWTSEAAKKELLSVYENDFPIVAFTVAGSTVVNKPS